MYVRVLFREPDGGEAVDSFTGCEIVVEESGCLRVVAAENSQTMAAYSKDAWVRTYLSTKEIK